MSILFALPFLAIWLIFELVTLGCQGLHHYIKGSGRFLLEKEFSDCWLNSINNKIICLRSKSELNGRYVSTTGSSILFPYYFSNNNNVDYGILIFSKEYFMVRNKFRELRKLSENKNKRLKFNGVV